MDKKKTKKTVSDTVCRVHKSGGYAVLSNCFVRSTNIGCAAIGLLGKIMDLPPEWNFTKAGIVTICGDGETAVETALAELEEWGYLKRTAQMPNDSPTGRICYVYDFYEYSAKDNSIPQYDYEMETFTVDNAALNRVKKDSNFTIISSKLLQNKEIKLKLLGFLLKVLSLPNYWNFSMSGLTAICKVSNRPALVLKLKDILLTDAERERMAFEFENTIEANLKVLNQTMHDDLHIAVGDRVELIAAMIMAGLGVKDEDGNVIVSELVTSDLKGDRGKKTHDGYAIYNRVAEFLDAKNLPADKRESIKNTLERVLLHSMLEEPRKVKNTSRVESRLKTVYREVEQNIMPTFLSAEHLDFTGKLFNVLNEWVDIPGGERNDVVLTPRYVTEFMAKLAEVNMNSYVWDYAAGSGGFLISAMKLMLKDAEQQYKTSPEKYADKVDEIKKYQLLGCEIRPDIYLLAVLNMILMKDGSATILNVDSLEKFSGTYEQGERKGQDFPADVFLLNPPYSALGKGFVFVEKALKRMKSGKACVLIQENAGSGNGLPYTKRLLEKNTLLASIHMADIFRGKASVQTTVYLFEVGKPHDVNKYVKFIDFSDDGYTRQNRKKSSQDVNLRDTGNAAARYQEVVDVILGRKLLRECEYLTEETYIEDKITNKGDDWTFNQHTVIDLTPTEDDFKKVVSDYLAWKVGAILRGEIEIEE